MRYFSRYYTITHLPCSPTRPINFQNIWLLLQEEKVHEEITGDELDEKEVEAGRL